MPQVGVDEEDTGAEAREGDREVRRDRRLAFLGGGAGHENAPREGSIAVAAQRDADEIQRLDGPGVRPVGLDQSMPRLVRRVLEGAGADGLEDRHGAQERGAEELGHVVRVLHGVLGELQDEGDHQAADEAGQQPHQQILQPPGTDRKRGHRRRLGHPDRVGVQLAAEARLPQALDQEVQHVPTDRRLALQHVELDFLPGEILRLFLVALEGLEHRGFPGLLDLVLSLERLEDAAMLGLQTSADVVELGARADDGGMLVLVRLQEVVQLRLRSRFLRAEAGQRLALRLEGRGVGAALPDGPELGLQLQAPRLGIDVRRVEIGHLAGRRVRTLGQQDQLVLLLVAPEGHLRPVEAVLHVLHFVRQVLVGVATALEAQVGDVSDEPVRDGVGEIGRKDRVAVLHPDVDQPGPPHDLDLDAAEHGLRRIGGAGQPRPSRRQLQPVDGPLDHRAAPDQLKLRLVEVGHVRAVDLDLLEGVDAIPVDEHPGAREVHGLLHGRRDGDDRDDEQRHGEDETASLAEHIEIVRERGKPVCRPAGSSLAHFRLCDPALRRTTPEPR